MEGYVDKRLSTGGYSPIAEGAFWKRVCYNAYSMQTIVSKSQLNRIENRLQRVTELLELLLGKITQEDESVFSKLIGTDLRNPDLALTI
jgi:hypothetical protein